MPETASSTSTAGASSSSSLLSSDSAPSTLSTSTRRHSASAPATPTKPWALTSPKPGSPSSNREALFLNLEPRFSTSGSFVVVVPTSALAFLTLDTAATPPAGTDTAFSPTAQGTGSASPSGHSSRGDGGDNSSPSAAIIGGATVGAAGGFFILTAFGFYCWRRLRKRARVTEKPPAVDQVAKLHSKPTLVHQPYGGGWILLGGDCQGKHSVIYEVP
uniref:Uncharacterized protein n=1 Tax=Ustilaginoidea virens TaxID=1159556 RepID=A0A1X9WE81_USTVR|nr:hypothetical protein [Ustilaginoidea virens]